MFKEKIQENKKKLAVAGSALMVPVLSAVNSLPVLAESTGTANTDVVNAMTTVAADMKATGVAIIPVALTVVGLALVVTYGIKIFNTVSKK